MNISRRVLLSTAISCALFGCSGDVKTVDLASVDGANIDNLYIVDCLLPSAVRQLGTKVTYLGARRVIKTSGSDCGLRGGEYVAYNRANYQTALKVWLPLAEAGDPKAQVYVGEIYEKGLGASPDYQKAANWYQRAAGQGDSRAKMNLGSLYERGLGVGRNSAQALNLYRDASGLGDRQVEFVSAVQRNQRTAQVKQLAQSQREAQAAQGRAAQLQRELQQLQAEAARIKSAPPQVQTRVETRTVVVRDPAQERAIQQLNTEVSTLRSQVNKTEVKIVQAPNNTKLQAENERLKGQLKKKEAEITQKQLAVSKPVSQTRSPEPEQVAVIEQKIEEKKQELTQQEEKATQLAKGEESISGEQANVSTLRGVNFGKFFAVVIGNNNYANMSNLQTAVNDASSVASVLKSRYGFNTIVLDNASRGKMLAALESLRKRLTENDNLLIYYAGHGELKGGQGFWLPADAQPGDEKTWISNAQVTNFIDAMAAKHVLVVADSCYSGTLSESSIPRPVLAADKSRAWFDAISKTKVRVVMTSGGLSPVLDAGPGNHSVFASAFLKTLESGPSVQEGAGLYQALRGQVSTSASARGARQNPLYAPIRFAGHEAGDFIFVKGGQLAALDSNPGDDDNRLISRQFYALRELLVVWKA